MAVVLADMPADYQHPAFPQPNDLNAVIWRYLDSDKFISMIMKAPPRRLKLHIGAHWPCRRRTSSSGAPLKIKA
jgi:hypothetical protein